MALAEALTGDSGWILLTYVPRDDRLINHSARITPESIAGGIPILALDMYEHAYHIEYGSEYDGVHRGLHAQHSLGSGRGAVHRCHRQCSRPRSLDQPEFKDVPSITPEEVQEMLSSGQRLQIIDTRPRHYSTRAQDIVEGAVWRDPERIEEWMTSLSKDEPVVTFCVYGFHIGCQSAAALRKAGFDARYMAGGHYAWKAIKGPVKLFESGEAL